MKKLINIILTLTTLSFSAAANSSSAAVVDANGKIKVDFYSACRGSVKASSCKFSYKNIQIEANCSTYFVKPDKKPGMFCKDGGRIVIKSSIPMTHFRSYDAGKMKDDNTYVATEGDSNSVTKFSEIGITTLEILHDKKGYYPNVVEIIYDLGIATNLNKRLKSASYILSGAYKGTLKNLNLFESKIAKSHRSHLARLKKSIQTGQDLLDNEKNPLPITHWKVQENARLIVVFGTVLNELLAEYDDVDYLVNSISSIKTLVNELRLSFGWNKGLAGNVSKAADALLDVMGLELQELGSIKMAMNPEGFSIYISLIKNVRALQAKIKASKSGDMKAQREIWTLVDLWNSQDWQDEMNNLLNAGPDFKNLVLPKLAMLLFAMESIEDLTEAGFIIPNADFVPKA